MDRWYPKPLDVPALARIALTSEAHFTRTFRQTFGETPHRYLQRRRLERAMALPRETTGAGTAGHVLSCVVMAWARPASHRDQDRGFGEARPTRRP